MADNFVINASPLIFLTKANELNLLRQVVKKAVFVPDRVELARNLRGFKNLEGFVSEWEIKERIEIMIPAY